MQVDKEANWPDERRRANINKIPLEHATTHYNTTDDRLFTTGAQHRRRRATLWMTGLRSALSLLCGT
jgi:hypothetical protein